MGAGLFRCTVCGGEVLIAAEYVTQSTVRVPALRCAGCEALHLDEAIARSAEERESVRLAKAERAERSAAVAESTSPRRPSNPAPAPPALGRIGRSGGRVLLVDDEDLVRAGHAQVFKNAGW